MPKRRNSPPPESEDGTQPLVNKRHEAFCMAYVGECRDNASAACLAVGYKTKNANVVGPRLLANVGIQRRISHLQEELAQQERLKAVAAVRRLKAIATVTVADFIGDDGKISLEKLRDPWLSQAVEYFTPIYSKDGDLLDYRVKLLDPMQAFEQLGLTEKKQEAVQNNQVLVIKV